MAVEKFIDKRFTTKTREMIDKANAILREYAAKGFTMTLRQLHYQFVARGIQIDGETYQNNKQAYQRLGDTMSNARLAGASNWAWMEDRLRELDRSPRWGSPASIIDAVADQYREDLWNGQKWRPEVWIEKDALGGIIEPICRELRIDFFACRGYVSQSAQYEASHRFRDYMRKGQEPVVFHFGDHDPSGIDMTRENRAKFELLCGRPIRVERLALNIEQVREYNPPPNFAKLTDSRAAGYVEEFGNESWELDALDPELLTNLIRDSIEPLINRRAWAAAEKAEQASRNHLDAVSTRWAEVVGYLEENPL
jgi:hypothetical protein